VTLGQGNTVRGLTIGDTTGFVGLRGDGFGTLSISEVTINGTGGVANLNNGSFGASSALTSAISTSSPGAGLSLTGIASGTLTIGGTSISVAAAQGIVLTGSGATVNFGDTTVSAGTIGVLLAANSGGASFGSLGITGGSGIGLSHDGGGSLSVTGATTIANPGGTGIDIRSLALATPVSFAATTVNKGSTAGTGVNLGGGATGNAGNVTFASLAITTSSGTALLGVNNTGSITVTTNGGSISATGGPAVDITKAAAPFTPVTLNFANTSSTGGTNAVRLQNLSGSANLGGGNLTGTAGGAAFLISGGTIGTTYTGNITQAAANASVSVINHSSGTIAFSTGTLSATGGTGLQFSNADGTYNFNGTTTLNGGDAGIDIVSDSDGTFSFSPATSITHSTNAGHAFVLDASNANITYGGTVTDNSGRAISINNHDGGSITFNGAISASGAGANGIHITNSNNSGSITFNGAVTLSTQGNAAVTLTGNDGKTIAFAGGLAITTTTGAGFTATGGGTLAVTGSVNTISSTGGIALNVQNTTIGAAGLTLLTVNSGGSGAGISLSNTGAGAVTITGNGASDTTNTTRGRIGAASGTGGTISGKTGNGITLNSTGVVTIRNMVIQNNAGHGIEATQVAGLTLDNTRITGHTQRNGLLGTGVNNLQIIHSELVSNATDDTGAVVSANDYMNMRMVSATGTASIRHSLFQVGAEHIARFFSTTGTLALTVENNTFSGAMAGTGFSIYAFGNSNITANVQGNTLQNNSAFGMDSGTETTQSASLNLTVTGNTFSNNFVGVTVAHGSSGTNTFAVTNNVFQTHGSISVNVNRLGGGAFTNFGLFSGVVSGNTIGTAGVANSGSAAGSPIRVVTNGNGGTTRVSILNNSIREYAEHAITVVPRDTTTGHTLHARVQGNTISHPHAFALDGVNVTMGALNTDVISLCVDIGGGTAAVQNSVANSPRNGIRVRSSGLPAANITLTAPGYDGTGATYFANRNPAATGVQGNVSFSNTNGTTSAGTCTTPSL
jgi:hypothetical protein